MTDRLPHPAERSYEVDHTQPRGPYGCHKGCVICDNHDDLRCSRGPDCCSINPAPIGEWIGENEDGIPRNDGAYVFAFKSMPDKYFCEDCAIELEEQANATKTWTEQDEAQRLVELGDHMNDLDHHNKETL